MGFMNFLKKKPSDLPVADLPLNQQLPPDLPPIDMNFEGSSMEKMPTMDSTLSTGDSARRTMSVNMPMLDFSMPPENDEPDTLPLPDIQGSKILETSDTGSDAPLPSFDTQINSDIQDGIQLSEEELNQLFISDGWKEPDWTSYEPYDVEKIDEPSPEDFKSEDLPQFGDINADLAILEKSVGDSKENTSGAFMPFSLEPEKTVGLADLRALKRLDEPEDNLAETEEEFTEPNEPFAEKSASTLRPIELYIRGKAYGKVFLELSMMSKTLSKMDTQTGNYEEMVKREEPLLISAREQMEYLYRRLSLIDKKIFIQ